MFEDSFARISRIVKDLNQRSLWIFIDQILRVFCPACAVGHTEADMGALEALNGVLLFGLTTAFLFALIQKVWPLGSRGRNREA